MAVRLVLGLICGLALSWLVWDRSERELTDQTRGETHERPRFLPASGSYYLPLLMLIYPILGAVVGGAQMAAQLTLGLLLRVFLEMGVYYVLLMAVMPWLRRSTSIRWLSVPPETRRSPCFCSSAASAAAFFTICC